MKSEPLSTMNERFIKQSLKGFNFFLFLDQINKIVTFYTGNSFVTKQNKLDNLFFNTFQMNNEKNTLIPCINNFD